MAFRTFSAQLLFRRDDQRVFGAGLAWADRNPGDSSPDPVAILHPDELRQYQAYKAESRRFTYLAGRLCAKQALGQLLTIPKLPSVHIDTGIFNQPIVRGLAQANWRVSITHDNTAALAVAFPEAHPISVDIESVAHRRRDWEADAFTLRERSLMAASSASPDVLKLICWTAKESLSKVLQTGLMLDLEVLGIESIRQTDQYYWLTFRHFFQYQALVFLYKDWAISLLFPLRSTPILTQVEAQFQQ